MKLSEYIKALQKLKRTLKDEDPDVVVTRYSDYTKDIARPSEYENMYPRIITLVDHGHFLMDDHPTLPPDQAAKRKRYIELAGGN